MNDFSDEGSVGGHALRDPGAAPKSYPKGRVCRESDCGTRLSMYNPGAYCVEHEPKQAPRMRGRKVA